MAPLVTIETILSEYQQNFILRISTEIIWLILCIVAEAFVSLLRVKNYSNVIILVRNVIIEI